MFLYSINESGLIYARSRAKSSECIERPNVEGYAKRGPSGQRYWPGKTLYQCTTLLVPLSGHDGPVNALALSNDGTLLATAGDDQVAMAWDLATDTEIATLRSNTDSLIDVAFSPDNATMATASDDGTARIWKEAPVKRSKPLDPSK